MNVVVGNSVFVLILNENALSITCNCKSHKKDQVLRDYHG